MRQTFFGRGKLLISAEYLVLKGARALAFPVKPGQNLEVIPADHGLLNWQAFTPEGSWFWASLQLPDLKIEDTSDTMVASRLQGLLKDARQLNPDFLSDSKGADINTQVGFDRSWGLGSSSTLVSNVALWADVDPYTLLWMGSKGSGYDIACARANQPIVYQLHEGRPVVEEASFANGFSNNIYFVYLGQKQDSASSVNSFLKSKTVSPELIRTISNLTNQMINANSLTEFNVLIREHEQFMSKVLGLPTVKSVRFKDFDGEVKSLGAWGGDFVMMSWNYSRQDLEEYLIRNGYQTCFGMEDLMP